MRYPIAPRARTISAYGVRPAGTSTLKRDCVTVFAGFGASGDESDLRRAEKLLLFVIRGEEDPLAWLLRPN